MKNVLSKLLHPWVLVTVGLAALSALAWWAGPLAAWNEWRPLEAAGPRVALIAALWGAAVVVALLAGVRRRRANAALLQGLASDAGSQAAAEEARVLRERFEQALALLKKLPGRRTLYDLPWYVFVGAPGAGKTTALLHAGLNFPLAEQMGQASVQGVGGTRHCDWWFTDEAVLIDTAGRYATQDSDRETDAAAWHTFLDLLRRARPRRPLNGVLLTVSVPDLLVQDAAQRREHAARLRGRLQELQQRLGVRAPVYVLVTKCDLLAGFHETFAALGQAEREQPFGFSFALKADPLAEFGAEFAALDKRLRERLLERMEARTDVMERALVFGFPQQFGAVKGLLGGFLESVFGGSGTLDERALLRGVYFTSGTQEGTPIDRVMGAIGRSWGVEQRLAAPKAERGRSYFLQRVLREVVFAEQGLVGRNAAAERRRTLLRGGAFAALALAVVGLGAGWTFSLLGNRAYVAEVQGKLPALQAAVKALPPEGSASGALDVLAAVRTAAHTAEVTPDDPPAALGLGLFQGPPLDAAADQAYRRLLEQTLLPEVLRTIEGRLRAATPDDLEAAYDALKAYQMLHLPEHLDAAALKAFVTRGRPADPIFERHLGALFEHGVPAGVPAADAALVARVREMLVAYPLEYRIASRLGRAGLAKDLPEFSIAAAAGPQAPSVFVRASGQALTAGIPALFTREGYRQAFRPAMARMTRQLAEEETWVMGTARDRAARIAADPGLAERVHRLYLEAYIKTWDAYLADLRLVRVTGLDRSLAAARLLSSVDSPLARLLRAAARETTLVEAPAPAGAASAVVTARVQEVVARQKDLALAMNQPGSKPAGPPLEQMVDDHFAPLRRGVEGLEDTRKLFDEAYVHLAAVDAAQKAKAPPPAGGGGAKLKAAAGQQPEPVRALLEAVADAAEGASRSAERQTLTSELQPIADFCSRAIAGRYPLAVAARADVLPEDFGQLFGPGGLMDEFFKARLAPLVDTGAAAWSYRPVGDGTRPVAPAALADFQRAARVREVFFRSGGRTPAIRVDVRALEMSEGMKELVLDVDGQVTKFAPGTNQVLSLQWPGARLASQIRLQAGAGAKPMVFEGPWALFRMFDRFDVQPQPQQPERFVVVMNLEGGQRAKLEVTAASVFNPFRLRELVQFRCPGAL